MNLRQPTRIRCQFRRGDPKDERGNRDYQVKPLSIERGFKFCFRRRKTDEN